MGIRRRIIIPAILALGTAASSLAVSAVPLAAVQASSTPAGGSALAHKPGRFL